MKLQSKPKGVMLGHYYKGDRSGLCIGRRNEIVLPLEQMRRHVLVLAGTPGEKNRIASQLMDGVAREDRKAQLFFFDNDGDPEMARLCGITASKTARGSLLFPDQPFNAWTGSGWRPIFDRLTSALNLVQNGPVARYAEMTKLVLQLACRLEGQPPRSSGELLRRLDYKTLCTAFGEEALPGIDKIYVEDVCECVKLLFADLDTSLDGERSFADLDSAYFSLYPLARAEATWMLLAQFLDYAQNEKDPDRLCVVFLRISAGIAGGANLPLLLEQARALGVVIVPILQRLSDLGSPGQIMRLLGGTGTLILDGDQVRSGLMTGIRLMGSVEALSPLDDQSPLRARQSASKVSRNDLLEMPQGRVVLISNGDGALVDVPPAS